MRLLPVPGVFTPRSDSWMLLEELDHEPIGPGARVLDLCSGSGILAIAAARRGASVVALDISRRSVITARVNARLNGVAIRAARSDLLAAVRGQSFDLIVSNPPYLPTVDGEPPRRGPARAWEGGSHGRVLIDRICAEVRDHLKLNGVLLLVHSSVCNERLTVEALTDRGLQAGIVARRRGPLGPLLRERTAQLSAAGLPADDGYEELVVVRARRTEGKPALPLAPNSGGVVTARGGNSIGGV